MSPTFKLAFLSGLGSLAISLACRASTDVSPTAQPSITTDSTLYVVNATGNSKWTAVAFTYTNRTGRTVSTGYCHAPPPPALDKLVGGEWVFAYKPVELACYSGQFKIPNDSVYRGALSFRFTDLVRATSAARIGDSVQGAYRLRLSLVRTEDIGKKNMHRVEAVSNTFRIAVK
jgi:hypothetical protein